MRSIKLKLMICINIDNVYLTKKKKEEEDQNY